MSTSNRRQLRQRQLQQRRRAQRTALSVESLEDRLLLASDFQNPILPTDVNADMRTDARDVLDIVASLYRDGSHQLNIRQFQGGSGEGEGPTRFVDVNGDNYLTPQDALDVVRYLYEGEGPQVSARFEITTPTGTVINSANVGDTVEVSLYIQDIRNPNDPDYPDLQDKDANGDPIPGTGDPNLLGLFSAFFDLKFPGSSVTIVPAANVDTDIHPDFAYGPEYQNFNTRANAGNDPIVSANLIEDLGGGQTDLLGGPVGPDEFLLWTVAFRIDAAATLLAVDDPGLQVDEGVVNAPLDVLANDSLGGDLIFERAPSDGLGNEVLTFLANENVPDSTVVPPGDIVPVNGQIALSVADSVFQGITLGSVTGGTASVNTNGTPTNFTDDFINFTPSGPGTALIIYTITDSGGGSSTATASISVGAINDPPVNIMPGNQSVNEDTTLTFNNANGNRVQTSDIDAGSAAVQMTLGVTNGTLAASSGGGVVVTGSGTNSLTLDGSIAAINALLSNPGFSFTGTQHFNGAAVLTVTTNDLGNTGEGGAKSDTDQLTITVQPVNDPPVNLLPTNQTTEEETPLVFNSANGNLISTSDVDAASGIIRAELTLTTSDGPSPGTVTLGTTTGVTIVSGSNGSSNVAFTGTLTSVNNALNGLTYTPATGFFGSVELQLSVNDQGNTGSGPAGVDTDSIQIDVESAVRPRARTDRFPPLLPAVFEGSANNILDVLANDEPNTGAQVTLLSFTAQTPHGDVTRDDGGTPADLTDDRLVYTPDPDFEGQDVFTYVINDTSGIGADSIGTVTVTVIGENDPPLPVDDLASTDEDIPLTIPGATLTGNDSPGLGEVGLQTLTVTAVSPTSTQGGTVSVLNNVVTYTPAGNFNGQDTFTYTVTDNGTTNGDPDPLSATATVTVTVRSVNDAPVPVNDPATTAEDTDLVVAASSLTANDSKGGGADENNQTLTIISVSPTSQQGGAVSLVGGQITYSPADNYNGPDSFTYVVRDNGTSNGVADPKSATGTVNVTVTEVNDAPTAGPDMADGVQTLPTEINVASLLSNDTRGPANESGQTLTVVSVSPTSTEGGTVTLLNGVVTYTPADGFSGLDTFTYTITDNGTTNGQPDPKTAVGTVTVDVAEFLPSTISGYVYVDGDNDSIKDAGERTVGGVTVTLSGTDFKNNPVNLTAYTDASGFYTFTQLRPGTYTVHEEQPFFLVDGKDHLDGIAANDQFTMSIGAQGDVTSTTNNFGERGLSPAYFTLQELRSAEVQNGFWAAQNTTNNSQYWFMAYNGWGNAASVETILSSDKSTVTLKVKDKAGTTHQTTVGVNVDHRARLLSGGRLLRIEGTAADFGFNLQASLDGSSEAEGEAPALEELQMEEMLAAIFGGDLPADSFAGAVDAAFAEAAFA